MAIKINMCVDSGVEIHISGRKMGKGGLGWDGGDRGRDRGRGLGWVHDGGGGVLPWG